MTTCKRLSMAIFLGAALLPAPALAQNSEDRAVARSLFDEGRRLLKAGKVNEACPKLEAAARIYASPGILLNLGDCYEKSGRTASAWSEFGESASAADRAGHVDQQVEARRRQAAVEPKLSRMVIVVTHEVPGLVVSRDGSDLAPAVWGSPIPIDPGTHTIRARADGREAWGTAITVNEPGKTVTLEVPELQASAGAPPPAAVAQPTPPSLPETSVDGTSSSARSPAAGIVLIGAGAAIGVAGVVLMVVESSKASSARSEDTPGNSQGSVDKYNSTKTPWAIGLGGAIAGGVSAALGIVLLTTDHRSKTGELRASPWVTAGGGGLTVGRTW